MSCFVLFVHETQRLLMKAVLFLSPSIQLWTLFSYTTTSTAASDDDSTTTTKTTKTKTRWVLLTWLKRLRRMLPTRKEDGQPGFNSRQPVSTIRSVAANRN